MRMTHDDGYLTDTLTMWRLVRPLMNGRGKDEAIEACATSSEPAEAVVRRCLVADVEGFCRDDVRRHGFTPRDWVDDRTEDVRYADVDEVEARAFFETVLARVMHAGPGDAA